MEEKKELKVSPALLQYTYRKLLEFLQKNHNFTREGLNRVSAYSGGYPFSISGDIRSVPS